MVDHHSRRSRRTPRATTPGGDRTTGTGYPGLHGAVLTLQRSIGNAATVRLLDRAGARRRSPVRAALADGTGTAVDPGVRHELEQRLGRDLGDVRVHTSRAAAEAIHDVGGDAFTIGRDVFVTPARYSPQTVAGRRLLVHELVHVAQQTMGPGMVTGTVAPDGVRVSEPGDELEHQAEQIAREITGPALSAAP